MNNADHGRGAKYHLQIEGQQLGQDNYTTYFLMGVDTMPDGEVISLDLVRDTNLENLRQIAKLRAQSAGCRIVEAL